MSWFSRTPKPSPELVQALANQAALQAKHEVDARLQSEQGFVDAGIEALAFGKFHDFIGEVDTTALEAMALPDDKLLGVVRVVSRAYYESYAVGLLNAPGAKARLQELGAAKKAIDGQFPASTDEKQRMALAVEKWRRVPTVSSS